MKAGLVRFGVTTTPEHAASASASSRMSGPTFRLIRMPEPNKTCRSLRTILASATWRTSSCAPLVLLGRFCYHTIASCFRRPGWQGRVMSSLLIRNVDDALRAQLRARAPAPSVTRGRGPRDTSYGDRLRCWQARQRKPDADRNASVRPHTRSGRRSVATWHGHCADTARLFRARLQPVILLDTNVVSETMKRRVDPVVAAFIDQLQIGELFLPSLVAGRNTLPIASAGGRSSPR
jgi:hypothetical protein